MTAPTPERIFPPLINPFLKSPGFWYLATPYTLYPEGIEAAFQEACRNAGLLIRAGFPVFSPIAHSHPIALAARIDPLSHEIWLPADLPMMEAAKGLIVCRMTGWENSYGVAVEMERFARMGKPIHPMTPGEIPPALLTGKAP